MAEEQTRPDLDFKVVENESRRAAELIPVTNRGVQVSDFAQLVDRAKFMSMAREAVPAHLRNNVGMCIAIHEMATEWGLRPYGVANLCYVVNNRLGIEAQLMVAVINKHAGLKQRLRPKYEGTGGERVCIVTGHFEGELDPCEYRSPMIKDINPKNSPLWKSDPDQQLFYYSARAFVRRYASHVMLGIYGADELQDNPQLMETVKPVSELMGRIAGSTLTEEGFKPDSPEDTIGPALAEAGHQPKPAAPGEPVQSDSAAAAVEAAKEPEPVPEEKPKRSRKAKDPDEAPNAGPREPQGEAVPAGGTETAPQAQPAPAASPEAQGVESVEAFAARASEGARVNNVPTYVGYAKDWMRASPSHAHRSARWTAEKPLRTNLGVMGDDLAELIAFGKELKAADEAAGRA